MPNKQDFIKEKFNVTDNLQDNKLLNLIKSSYPSIIKDGEIKLDELKTALNLPIDNKVNGYGLNFIGRNVAKAKYAKETDKALKINTYFSKDFDKTQNMVIKGDNLDVLKLLKTHYNGKIKCIYIDPPYNTDSEEFIYPDKFNKEEQEVLGLTDINEDDLERLEFSFKSKKSHNGWLTFMYPRLMLARDLLTDDGVIFISIDDNEQANLKLLCDDVFGEGNFVGNAPRKTVGSVTTKSDGELQTLNDFIMIYGKDKKQITFNKKIIGQRVFSLEDVRGKYYLVPLQDNGPHGTKTARPNLYYPIYQLESGELSIDEASENTTIKIFPKKHKNDDGRWMWSKKKFNVDKNDLEVKDGNIYIKHYYRAGDDINVYQRERLWLEDYKNAKGTKALTNLSMSGCFGFPKPVELVKFLLSINDKENFLILDFFAGSGTTGHAVMELNKEDGGNRKFILCQIDEPIDKNKNSTAYDFCIKNNLPPVISSITIERLNRAGENISQEAGLLSKDLDTGYKVFDLVDKPKLVLKEAQMEIEIENNKTLTPLDRIYNMIFKVGIDNPLIPPKEILKNCLYAYHTNNIKNYYITNSQALDDKKGKELFKQAINDGNVYIDGWTATINTTLQEYKKDVKIVF